MGSAQHDNQNIQRAKIYRILAQARHNYINRNPESRRLHEEAVLSLPGGNTRSVLHSDPFPICIEKAHGNRLVDVDGHEYLDLIGDMTAGLYGHSHPKIQETLISTIRNKGLNIGATTTAETQFASVIRKRIPSIQKLRFCNSGTEANLYALSVARHVTGLSKVIVFKGAYHGGLLTFAHGVAANNVDKADWIVGKYNDVDDVKRLLAENKGKAAAVLVEGMLGAGGAIPGSAEFLHAIQEGAKENNIIFILDEVMTFRLAPGGLQSALPHPQTDAPLTPDLVTLGKTIAGGIGIGAFGGRSDLMSIYDPRTSSIAHSGTFNNNSLAMAAGCIALPEIYTAEACRELNRLGDEIREVMNDVARGTRMRVSGVGSIMCVHFLAREIDEIRSIEDVAVEPGSVETGLKELFWLYALEQGYWIHNRGAMSFILGTEASEVKAFVDDVVEGFLGKYMEFMGM